MNRSTLVTLVRKDLHLMRWPLAAYAAAALISVWLVIAGGASTAARLAGLTLALNVLIGASFHVMLGPVLGERERKTLAFVLALPATPRDVALAKVVAAFALFLVPGVIATAPIAWISRANGGLGIYACVLAAWLCLFGVVLAAAVVTESIGATIGTLLVLLFVLGNGILQVAPHSSWLAGYLRALSAGGLARPLTLAAEAGFIALVVGAMTWLQNRKTSFV